MSSSKISRRQLVLGTASAVVAGTLPLRTFSLTGNPGISAGQSQPPLQQPNIGSRRADWMQNERYAWGVMTHYLADWQSHVHKSDMTVERWDKMIDAFDVEAMARRLEQVGAGHYQLSIGQNSGYYLSPNQTYDKFVGIRPSKCSHRDLVADFSVPLQKRDIKLMVYLPAGAPNEDRIACEALEWVNGAYPNKNFQQKWEQIIAEWSSRWGSKVAGWWFDGCYFPNSMYRSTAAPNFASFAAAARVGNSESALAFNPGVIYHIISISPDEDYTAGEIDKPEWLQPIRAAGAAWMARKFTCSAFSEPHGVWVFLASLPMK